MKVRQLKGKPAPPKASSLAECFERYAAILHAARDFVVLVADNAVAKGEPPYVTTREIARHIAEDRPVAYLRSFGRNDPRTLKQWRALQLLRMAKWLGAYEALGLVVVHGRGVTMAERPATKAKVA